MHRHHEDHLYDSLKFSLAEQYFINDLFTKEKLLFLFDENEKPTPFILFKNSGNPFEGIALTGYFTSPFFILKSVDEKHCCAVLALLEPVGIDGCTVEFPGPLYSLLETDHLITVSLNHFCGLQILPRELVNRPIPDCKHNKC
ncbi:CotY/CotZ family spore coat protein [Peribacillus kribbensis]|uniref:CotY/CotZ family spore coat protein n=1 Tax=Peribacillus kribbensis TaxID=356658 RepID=UPI000688DC9E|nr:CotY/CotZ family spore coat protein [Peribacillus kribbensis]